MMKKVCLLFVVAVMLSGCGLTKKDLGMARTTPDETKIQTRDQLVLPPDYAIRPERNAK